MIEKIQYWKGMTFMGLVTPEKADEIERNARQAGWKVIRQPAMISIEPPSSSPDWGGAKKKLHPTEVEKMGEGEEMVGGFLVQVHVPSDYEPVEREIKILIKDAIENFVEKAKGEIEMWEKHFKAKGYSKKEIKSYIYAHVEPKESRVYIDIDAIVETPHIQKTAYNRFYDIYYVNYGYDKEKNEAGLAVKEFYKKLHESQQEQKPKEEEKIEDWRDRAIERAIEIAERLEKLGHADKAEMYKKYAGRLTAEKKFINDGYEVMKYSEYQDYYKVPFEDYDRFIPLQSMKKILDFIEKYNPDHVMILSDYGDPIAVAVFGDPDDKFAVRVIVEEW